jgi:hypothetical protein
MSPNGFDDVSEEAHRFCRWSKDERYVARSPLVVGKGYLGHNVRKLELNPTRKAAETGRYF